ncbi:MAG: transposase [Oscillospiraceae bacterium]|jgi:putative transposase|nr:transposase [Oscillospiraceae bacterium]
MVLREKDSHCPGDILYYDGNTGAIFTMRKMNRVFKFRIYPNTEQRDLFAKTFGCCRFIYNKMLSDKIKYFEETGNNLKPTPAQYKNDFPWLREVDSLALANVQLHLEAVYMNFFQRVSVKAMDDDIGFPSFKSKHKWHNSYTTNLVNGNIVLVDGSLKLPKLGKIKIKQHRQIPINHRLKSVTVSLTPAEKYYASLLYEYDIDITPIKPVDILELDFNISQYPRSYFKAQERLVKEHRKLSQRKKGGSNYNRQRLKVARLQEYITNQQADIFHKHSRQIANNYDAVRVAENNKKSIKYEKSLLDDDKNTFTQILDYKLIEQGKRLLKANK